MKRFARVCCGVPMLSSVSAPSSSAVMAALSAWDGSNNNINNTTTVALTQCHRHFSTTSLLCKSISNKGSNSYVKKGLKTAPTESVSNNDGRAGEASSNKSSASGSGVTMSQPAAQCGLPTPGQSVVDPTVATVKNKKLTTAAVRRMVPRGSSPRDAGVAVTPRMSSQKKQHRVRVSEANVVVMIGGKGANSKANNNTTASSSSGSVSTITLGGARSRKKVKVPVQSVTTETSMQGTSGTPVSAATVATLAAGAAAAEALLKEKEFQEDDKQPIISTTFAPAVTISTFKPAMSTRAPVYFTEKVLDHQTPTEEELIAERASVTKLFMVSDSFSSIFSSLPADHHNLNHHLRQMDAAVVQQAQPTGSLPTPTSSPSQKAAVQSEAEEVAGTGSVSMATDSESIVRRLMAEEAASHVLCVHVREMEQLVPPLHLLNPEAAAKAAEEAATAAASSKIVHGRSSRKRVKGGKSVNDGAAPFASPSPFATAVAAEMPLATPSLAPPVIPEVAQPTPIERVMALRKWQIEARARATSSQKRYCIPESYHTITRLRFHDPHKADVVVVQGTGSAKTPADVLGLLSRKLNPTSANTADGDDVADGEQQQYDIGDYEADQIAPFRQQQQQQQSRGAGALLSATPTQKAGSNAMLTAPYVLRPLLTVYANCVPRRETVLGSAISEEVFYDMALNATSSTGKKVGRRRRKSSRTSASSPALGAALDNEGSAGNSSGDPPLFRPNTMTEDAISAVLRNRGVPLMPRHLTRVTVLVEHNDLTPIDLLALAEISVPRKDNLVTTVEGSSSRTVKRPARKMNEPRIYCLVVDGGEL